MIRKFILAALLLCAPTVWAQGTISAMTAASALTGTELFECVQSGSKKCTAAQIKTFTSASPTLVTPNIGTPSAGVLTNATGYTVGALSGAGTGVLTALAVNVGSAGAPVVNGGALGTPSSGTLTNATGLPAAGVVGTAATLGANTFTALQTITQASANAGILASTGYSLTGTNATGMVSLAGTLNTTGNPDVFKIAVTDTASGSSTNLFRVYGAASGAYPHFTIAKSGNVTFSAASGGTAVEITAGGDIRGARYRDDTNHVAIGSYSTAYGVIVKNTGGMNWSADSTWYGTTDTFLTRGGAAATIQLGAAAAASPVAQTLQSQPSRAGTDTNVAGANLTTRPGAGTGNSAPASYIIQTYVPVASGTGVQTATAALTLSNSLTLGSHIVTPASTGTRYLCIDTAGVVTSSASACSGT